MEATRFLLTMMHSIKYSPMTLLLGCPSENFQYAVEIMSKHIEEHALSTLHKTEDFKYICAEYD